MSEIEAQTDCSSSIMKSFFKYNFNAEAKSEYINFKAVK